jgi:uncharacterized protein (UPF0276 family)
VCKELTEIDFVNAVLKEADCLLLLDVNNIYVNSHNHKFEPVRVPARAAARARRVLPRRGQPRRVARLKIDTHGAPLVEPVYELLEAAYRPLRSGADAARARHRTSPRSMELAEEVARIRSIQQRFRRRLPAPRGAVVSSPIDVASAPLPKFQRLQYEFCARLRDPDRNPVPAGIEDRRMNVYVD